VGGVFGSLGGWRVGSNLGNEEAHVVFLWLIDGSGGYMEAKHEGAQ
jgi:hypothetical protein